MIHDLDYRGDGRHVGYIAAGFAGRVFQDAKPALRAYTLEAQGEQ